MQRSRIAGVENRFGKPGSFAAEYEHIFTLERCIPNRSFGKAREKEQPSRSKLPQQVVPIDRVAEFQVLPIVEPRAAQPGVIDPKPGGSDNPQFGAGGDTCPTDVASVLRNLGLVQDHVRSGHVAPVIAIMGITNMVRGHLLRRMLSGPVGLRRGTLA